MTDEIEKPIPPEMAKWAEMWQFIFALPKPHRGIKIADEMYVYQHGYAIILPLDASKDASVLAVKAKCEELGINIVWRGEESKQGRLGKPLP